MIAYIYSLSDPRTNTIRYVGKTCYPHRRLRHHCNDPANNHRTNWLRSLTAAGVTPEMDILEEVLPGSSWEIAERFWIAYLRFVGAPLTNSVAGGEGGSNPSTETRQKLRNAKLGRRMTETARAKLIASRTGMKFGPFSPERKARHSARLRGIKKTKPRSPEHTAKHVAATRATWERKRECGITPSKEQQRLRKLATNARCLRKRMELKNEIALA